jgi:error-prone DNA polymerase
VIRLARRYAELATTTNFSFLRGASHPEEMVARAAELGLSGIGIADRNTLAGVVRAHVYARENRETLGAFRVVTGTRLAFVDGAPDVIVYPQDRAAYGRLSRLLSQGNLRAPKGECHLRFDELLESAEGLQAIATPPFSRKGRGGNARLTQLREAFAGRLWIGAQPTYDADMRGGLAERVALARKLGAPLIAVNDVLMHDAERRPLADVVACIREKTTLAAAGLLTQANAERHLKGPEEMARLFAEAPDALEETMRFLDGIAFSLDELAYGYPEELRAGYATPQQALEAFAEAGAQARYPDGVPDRVRAALDHELKLVAQLGYAPYFLTVYDIVCFARNRRTSSARGAARRPIRRSATASGSPKSTRRASTCCSSASSRPSAASRPTSTSISSMSGARR